MRNQLGLIVRNTEKASKLTGIKVQSALKTTDLYSAHKQPLALGAFSMNERYHCNQFTTNTEQRASISLQKSPFKYTMETSPITGGQIRNKLVLPMEAQKGLSSLNYEEDEYKGRIHRELGQKHFQNRTNHHSTSKLNGCSKNEDWSVENVNRNSAKSVERAQTNAAYLIQGNMKPLYFTASSFNVDSVRPIMRKALDEDSSSKKPIGSLKTQDSSGKNIGSSSGVVSNYESSETTHFYSNTAQGSQLVQSAPANTSQTTSLALKKVVSQKQEYPLVSNTPNQPTQTGQIYDVRNIKGDTNIMQFHQRYSNIGNYGIEDHQTKGLLKVVASRLHENPIAKDYQTLRGNSSRLQSGMMRQNSQQSKSSMRLQKGISLTKGDSHQINNLVKNKTIRAPISLQSSSSLRLKFMSDRSSVQSRSGISYQPGCQGQLMKETPQKREEKPIASLVSIKIDGDYSSNNVTRMVSPIRNGLDCNMVRRGEETIRRSPSDLSLNGDLVQFHRQQIVQYAQRQSLNVQRQPLFIQQQPLFIQRQPLFVQQKPLLVQRQPLNIQRQSHSINGYLHTTYGIPNVQLRQQISNGQNQSSNTGLLVSKQAQKTYYENEKQSLSSDINNNNNNSSRGNIGTAYDYCPAFPPIEPLKSGVQTNLDSILQSQIAFQPQQSTILQIQSGKFASGFKNAVDSLRNIDARLQERNGGQSYGPSTAGQYNMYEEYIPFCRKNVTPSIMSPLVQKAVESNNYHNSNNNNYNAIISNNNKNTPIITPPTNSPQTVKCNSNRPSIQFHLQKPNSSTIIFINSNNLNSEYGANDTNTNSNTVHSHNPTFTMHKKNIGQYMTVVSPPIMEQVINQRDNSTNHMNNPINATYYPHGSNSYAPSPPTTNNKANPSFICESTIDLLQQDHLMIHSRKSRL